MNKELIKEKYHDAGHRPRNTDKRKQKASLSPEAEFEKIHHKLGWPKLVTKLERECNHWEDRALTAERERDEALNILREINNWINVAVMRPPTPNEAADAINAWGDKIRPILEVTE